MSSYFIDSSSLAKRYMPETGTVWMRRLTVPHSGHEIFIAQMTAVELMSAVARQYHDGTIDLKTLRGFRELIARHIQHQYRVMALNSAIIQRALNLHEAHRLRAYDAVQLASALELQQRANTIGDTITFIASDIRLLQAASASGLTTDNPNNYP